MFWQTSHTDNDFRDTDGSASWTGFTDQASGREPIAIVGMGCRLPGQVSSESQFWQFLLNECSGQSRVPARVFNIDAFYKPGTDLPQTIGMDGGYFIEEDVRQFENTFFGINNLEARYMDPQQRKLLEVCFECLENAGITLEQVAGANIGCYVGNFTTDFANIVGKDTAALHRYSATGMGMTLLSNRVSFAFNLKGPSLTLDTACSSSLYSLHLAAKALQQHECDGAFVAGANLIQSPEQHIGTAKLGVLSKTSTCHTFSAQADGYGRAEGVGALYLKRLSDAVRDGDPIRSVIRGTAINSNGKTPGITMPSAAGQQQVIEKAYADAGFSTRHTGYVECHGTGTPVGDPIEVAAVARVFRDPVKNRHDREALLLGSVKTNFGHSEAASGITSIIKATLALEHKQIPATIGVQELSASIPWHEHNVDVVRSLTPWPLARSSRNLARASINSFGYGGANAHCILEEFPGQPVVSVFNSNGAHLDYVGRPCILPMSAASEFSLQARWRDLASVDFAHTSISDLAYTLTERRTSLECRSFVLAGQNDVGSKLRLSCPEISKVRVLDNVPLTFVFTGQGAQWPQMGSSLIRDFKTYRDRITKLDNFLSQLSDGPDWQLKDVLMQSPQLSTIHLSSRSQPLCTAVQIALVDLLSEWRIFPKYVIGHSSGEIAAAYAAGHISSSCAIAIAYYRGKAVSTDLPSGAMIAVGIGSHEARETIASLGHNDSVVVACINSPENVTISGDSYAIDALQAEFTSRNKFVRKLKTDGKAYHSQHMRRVGQSYEERLNSVAELFHQNEQFQDKTRSLNDVEMVSTVYGRVVNMCDTSQSTYWRTNLESPVRFADGFEILTRYNPNQVVEIGPHPAMELPIKQSYKYIASEDQQLPYLSALVRDKNSTESILNLVGNLWTIGYRVSLNAVNKSESSNGSHKSDRHPQALHTLAPYKWNYSQLLWSESRISTESRHREFPHDEILGSRVAGGSGMTFTWRNLLKAHDVEWLQDHKLDQDIVLPAAAYISMASKALQQIQQKDSRIHVVQLRDVRISKALVLTVDQPVELCTELEQKKITAQDRSDTWWNFTVTAYATGEAVLHAAGCIGYQEASNESSTSIDSHAFKKQEIQGTKHWYAQCCKVGLNFGSTFRSLSTVSVPRMKDSMGTEATMSPFPKVMDSHHGRYKFDVHPIVLDAQLQATIIATASGSTEELKAQVPTSIDRVTIYPFLEHSKVPQYKIRAAACSVAFGLMKADVELVIHEKIALRFDGIRATQIQLSAAESIERHPLLHVEWVPTIQYMDRSHGDALKKYIRRYLQESVSDHPSCGDYFRSLIQILSRQRCDLDVLQLIHEPIADIDDLREHFNGNSRFKRFKSFLIGKVSAEGELLTQATNDPAFADQKALNCSKTATDSAFDLVMVADFRASQTNMICRVLRPEGIVLVMGNKQVTDVALPGFETVKIECCQGKDSVMLAWRSSITKDGNDDTGPLSSDLSEIVLVVDSAENPLNNRLQEILASRAGCQTRVLSLDDDLTENIPMNCSVICTAELEHPLLVNISERQLQHIQAITRCASRILWVTGGNLAGDPSPDFAAVLGLSRAIMREQPGLQFLVADLDDSRCDLDKTAQHLLAILTRPSGSDKDHEFVQRDGLLLVSRFVPDLVANASFNHSKNGPGLAATPNDSKAHKLMIKEPGRFETLGFAPATPQKDVPEGYVEIEVKSFGINAKDLYTLAGRVETQDCTPSLEFAGLIRRVGAGVNAFREGDKVAVAAPNHFLTIQSVPYWACCRLEVEDDLAQMSTVPVVFMTALHALVDRAKLKQGETVLIHSGAGGVGIAAIRLAKYLGAEVFATAGTDDKRHFLVQKLGINSDHIFPSRDNSFLHHVRKATGGRGVNVVLNSLTGEQLHSGLEACAMFGRFIEIGKRDIMEAGNIGLKVFSRGLTFSAFDLSEYYYSTSKDDHATWERLLHQGIETFHRVSAPSPRIFNLGDVSAAFKFFANSTRIGKVAVSCETDKGETTTIYRRYNFEFQPNKCYLLVGCLGGMGRSISRYMLSNGAHNFTFIGRSGTDKEAARLVVEDLREYGANVDVVRGDVQDISTVTDALDRMQMPLGGVIQAAMGLGESLFDTMTYAKWQQSLSPKIQGTWNLHNATLGRDQNLDFFLLTSSLAGSVGTATESNYCTANSFLDYFAKYRKKQGLPGTSIGFGTISEVGYLHEHPEIEDMLNHRGLTATTEAEMLSLIDIALHQQRTMTATHDFSESHYLSGLESNKKRAGAWSQGYEGAAQAEMADPRLAILMQAELRENTPGLVTIEEDGIPPVVREALLAKDERTLEKEICQFLAQKLSQLVLIPIEKIGPDMHLSTVGIDSMLAAEYRTVVFRALHTDVPFLTLMEKGLTVLGLSQMIAGQLMSQTMG